MKARISQFFCTRRNLVARAQRVVAASEKAVENALPLPSVKAQPFALTQARCGEPLRIVGLRPNSEACRRLREMGFCESAEVCKVVDGTALICVLQGVRMAIGRNLGADVFVEHLSPTP